MKAPLENILALNRVKLAQRVPLAETKYLVKRYRSRPQYHNTLIRHAKSLAAKSYFSFCDDENVLLAIASAINSYDYKVSVRSQIVVGRLADGTYRDGEAYKQFSVEVEPLLDLSEILKQVVFLAESKADTTMQRAQDVGLLIGIEIPNESLFPYQPSSSPSLEL